MRVGVCGVEGSRGGGKGVQGSVWICMHHLNGGCPLSFFFLVDFQ